MNPNEFLKVDKLRQRTRFNDKEIGHLCRIIGDKELTYFIRDYQADYAEERIKCEIEYAHGKKAFTKLECLLPLLEHQFNEGRSRLDDILDFFGVKNADEIFVTVAHYDERFHHRHPNIKADPIKLYGWIRRCELDFKTMPLPDYDPQGLKEWLEEGYWSQHINHINNVDFIHPLPEHFAQFGVGIISLPFLPDTIIEGDQQKIFTGVEWIGSHPMVLVAPGEGEHEQIWVAVFEEVKKKLLSQEHKDHKS